MSHGTIHTFKNYCYSVFSFQQNKLYPNGPLLDKTTQWGDYSSLHTLTSFLIQFFFIKWKIASPKFQTFFRTKIASPKYFGRP